MPPSCDFIFPFEDWAIFAHAHRLCMVQPLFTVDGLHVDRCCSSVSAGQNQLQSLGHLPWYWIEGWEKVRVLLPKLWMGRAQIVDLKGVTRAVKSVTRIFLLEMGDEPSFSIVSLTSHLRPNRAKRPEISSRIFIPFYKPSCIKLPAWSSQIVGVI